MITLSFFLCRLWKRFGAGRKKLLLVIFVLAAAAGLRAQENDHRPLIYDVAAGWRSYYIPGMGADWSPAEWTASAGVQQSFNQGQTLGLALRIGYSRGRYQGDALEAQLLFKFTPVVAKRLEPGIGLGVGYRFSFYPSAPQRWDGEQWAPGRKGKGIFQAPVQLSLGYRSIKASNYELRPYVAYQLQALFGYSPDLSLLPVSNALIGIQIVPLNK